MIPLEIENIRAQVKQKVAELGAELLEIQYRRSASTGVITFVVDKVGGVTLDDCAVINQSLGTFFDDLAEPKIQGPYLLEVNSPGLDRPLSTQRDFERTAGQKLKLTRKEASGKAVTEMGTVSAVKNGVLTFAPEGREAVLQLPLASIVHAVRQIRFKK